MLDTNHSDPNHRLIINGLSEQGDAQRWADRQYVRKLYLRLGEKSLLIDTGFRGRKAAVIQNQGFEVNEKELAFHRDAEIHCWECRFKTQLSQSEAIKKHRETFHHQILDPVRNLLSVTIPINNNVIKVNVVNINGYNLQPCQFSINYSKEDAKDYTGCMVDQKYAQKSGVADITSTDETVAVAGTFETECAPCLANRKWGTII